MVEVLLLDTLGSNDPSSYLNVTRQFTRTVGADSTQTFFSNRTIYDSTVFTPGGASADGTTYLGHVAIGGAGALTFNPDVVISGMVGGVDIATFLAGEISARRPGERIWSDLLSGDDYIRGSDGRDPQVGVHELHGYVGNDVIQSGTLNTFMYGDNGNDVLFLADTYSANGGNGRDLLILDQPTSRYAFIQDFVVHDDTIGLLDDIFPELGNAVTRANIRFGSAARDADDRLIVDFQNDAKTSAVLWFDADGRGPAEQRLIGRVASDAPVTVRDFTVVHANDFIPEEYQALRSFPTHEALSVGDRFVALPHPLAGAEFALV